MVDEGRTSAQIPESPEGPQEVGEVQTPSLPPSPSCFEFGHLFSSPIPPDSSPPFFIQFVLKKPATSMSLMEVLPVS